MDKQQHKTKKLTIDFPADEFVYLKMTCAKQDISIKDFVTRAVIKSVEDYEEELDVLAFKEAYTEENIANAVPWSEVKKELGWEKEA